MPNHIATLLAHTSAEELETTKQGIQEEMIEVRTQYTELKSELMQVEEALRNRPKANSKPKTKPVKGRSKSKATDKPAPAAEESTNDGGDDDDNDGVDIEDVEVVDEDEA